MIFIEYRDTWVSLILCTYFIELHIPDTGSV